MAKRINTILGHLETRQSSVVEPQPTLSWGILGDVVESERHGGELVARVLKAHGVRWIFTLTGGHISPILVASNRLGIRIIDTRHEVTCVFAADATARLTGIPGVAAVTAGPGVTNTITAVKNAQMAQSPLVLLGGAAATMLKGRGALQDIDQLSVFKPIVKFHATCASVREIVPTLRKAFQEATSGVPGPVFVELPLDVLYPIEEVKVGIGLSNRTRTREVKDDEHSRVIVPVEHSKKSVKEYLSTLQPDQPVFLQPKDNNQSLAFKLYGNYIVRKIFASAWEDVDFGPLPVHYPKPSASNIQQSLALLRDAKKPVLIVSSQAMLAASRASEIQKAVLSLGLPTFLGGMARGLLGANSKYHIRQNRGYAIKQADVVILAGTVCDFRLDYGRGFGKQTKIISVNRSSDDLRLNSGIFWTPALGIQADPGEYILALAAAASKETKKTKDGKSAGVGGQWDEWVKGLKTGETKKEAANAKKGSDVARGRGKFQGQELINPIALFSALEELLPENSILVADGGDFVATASYVLRPRGPLTWLDPGAFGTLGVGGGFALGAKLCRPDAEVWLIWGDGSAGYSIAEYDTFKRHGLSMIGLIGNDAGWTQIEREQVPMFNDNVACPLDYCAYDQVAVGYGGAGLQVQKISDVVTTIKEAQRLAKSGLPVVVNAMIGKSDFREGSLSV